MDIDILNAINIQKKNITDLNVDAIVNAANEDLKPSGGVCGAVFKAAGYDKLQTACKAIGHCDIGATVITDGFDTKAKYIIHAVGPKWNGGRDKEESLLYDAFYKSLVLAKQKECRSIGFPLISTGGYKFPKEKAWLQAILACREFLKDDDENMQITFAVLDDETLELGQRILKDVSESKVGKYVMSKPITGYRDFIAYAICDLDLSTFADLRDILIDGYITFPFLDKDRITIEILAEKMCDYFASVQQTTGKTYDKQFETYMNDLDSIVGPHIAKSVTSKKNGTDVVETPRARKYYEKALQIKTSKELTFDTIIDYTRIMICLYSAIIANKKETIENFNLSLDCLNLKEINNAMKKEEVSFQIPPFPPTIKKRFDIKGRYGSDTCTIVVAIIMICSIMNGYNKGGDLI